jgi:hypothetical protein
MRRYVRNVPPPPIFKDWTGNVTDWGVMMNDTLGCCTISAEGHTIQGWTVNASQEYTVPDTTIVDIYSAACGYVKGDPSTDQGGDEQTVLKYWQNNPINGHKLDAWAITDVTNEQEIKQAIWLTGGVYIAVQLPLTAQKQDVWDVAMNTKPSWWKFWAKDPSDPGSWGGHAVRVLAYDQDSYTVITWGKKLKMTKAFWQKYVVECYALLSKDWVARNGESPSGFTYQILAADMPSL